MALPRMAARPSSLRELLGLDPQPGEVPSGIAFNEAIPESMERTREAQTLASMDARTSASMAQDLAEANAVRGAREQGFTGMYPLREQQEYLANQKLRELLEPRKLELETAQQTAETLREFQTGQQAERIRAASQQNEERIKAAAERQRQAQEHARNMAKITGRTKEPGFLESLWGSEAETAPEIGTTKVLPNGITVEWDGRGWAKVE